MPCRRRGPRPVRIPLARFVRLDRPALRRRARGSSFGPLDGKREHEIVLKLNAEAQAKQPGVKQQ